MKTILVIDDEQGLVELLKFRLEINNYKVDTALDGEEGLEKIKKTKPDLVILDVMLPKMSGYVVCAIAKKDKDTASIPIIILSARTQEKDLEECKKCGADAFIGKPFEPAELLGEIKKLLKS